MIALAKKEGDAIRLYDENGNILTTIYTDGKLLGYTATTVSVQEGTATRIYDESGNIKTTVY